MVGELFERFERAPDHSLCPLRCIRINGRSRTRRTEPAVDILPSRLIEGQRTGSSPAYRASLATSDARSEVKA